MTNSEVRQEIEQMIAQTETMLARGKEMQARLDVLTQRYNMRPEAGYRRVLDGCVQPEDKALTIRLLQEWAAMPNQLRELIARQIAKKLRPANVSVIGSRYRI
ncbi:MAG: hypothetical protein JO308_09645 [Verrucomicrobia bacterium]|nr:hypothetical protein [Verrucomicrobiota bacterium]